MEDPILNLNSISPDGRWAAIGVEDDKNPEHSARVEARPLAGGAPVPLCRVLCIEAWSTDGQYFRVYLGSQTYVMNVKKETGLPELPKAGLSRAEDFNDLPKAKVLPGKVDSLVTPDEYAFGKSTVRRNIFRVPLE